MEPACNPSAEKVGSEGYWGLLASKPSLVVSSKPMRDPVSQEVNGVVEDNI